ncbi:hypothetical protein [Gorillibacterium sp. CAU 1737]|uniref:hypothetical protein n=1 Tax=Gorillibacterium sp. CAU 1737 TaxID=3140362 RepID=UPI003260EC43
MPVPNFQPLEQGASLDRTNDYIFGFIRRLNDFLAHMDTLNIDELNADVINAGTINAALVKVGTALNSGGYIQIDSNGLTINDGTKDTFRVGLDGKPIMTGGTVRSNASGYPKLEFNSDNGLISAEQDANTRINLRSNGVSGNPQSLQFISSGNMAFLLAGITTVAEFIINTTNAMDINISSGRDLRLYGTRIFLESFSQTIDNATGQTLQGALNSKANAFTGASGTVYVSATSGGPANIPITFSSGVRTS